MEKEDQAEKPAAKPSRGQLYARVHYGVLAAAYIVLLVVALVALGSFGAIEALVRDFQNRYFPSPESSESNCILYVTFTGQEVGPVRIIRLGSTGSCGFVLWGQASALIVVAVWLVYSIVLLVLGRKV